MEKTRTRASVKEKKATRLNQRDEDDQIRENMVDQIIRETINRFPDGVQGVLLIEETGNAFTLAGIGSPSPMRMIGIIAMASARAQQALHEEGHNCAAEGCSK